MGEPQSKSGRGLAVARLAPVAWVVLAWVGALVTNPHRGHWRDLIAFLGKFAFKALGGFAAAQDHAQPMVDALGFAVQPMLAAFASWATFLVPLGFLARLTSRAWIRSGGDDSLDRARRWVKAHPAATAGILALAPLVWGLQEREYLYGHTSATYNEVLPFAIASALFQLFAARTMLRAFLQPTVDPTEASRIEISPDEISFDAVAVTREATAAIGAVGALSVVLCVWIAALPLAALFRDVRIVSAIAAYAALATVAATYYRFASRVAVGIDGVLVKGTSRTRFYSYRDIDDVRVTTLDLELVRRGRVVLRLQLHGADAIRREAVADRIRTNIERVRKGESAVAAQIVSSSSRDQLARVAAGGADYRGASLSREALWTLIEGPTVDATSRRAAAEALVRTSDATERVRLRVAADLCADPTVRVALTELADAAPAEEEANPARRAVAS